jgi:D-beta-D-heptose 7-phosphate kinase/D-beta-D-heptose 1-phosphate adenosyltransferase
MIDQYYSVTVNRISPEFPIPVLKSSDEKPDQALPGGAANVCHQLSRMNVDSHLVSLLDLESIMVLEKHDLDLSYSVVGGWGTKIPIKKRYYHGESPFCRIDIEPDTYNLSPKDLQLSQNQLFDFYAYANSPRPDVLILSDYSKGVFQGIENRKRWISLGVPTIVDPKAQPIEGWKGCTVFKPNAEEALRLSRETKWEDQTQFFRSSLECESVVITQGGEGVVGWDGKTGKFFEYHHVEREFPQSVIGAGDCFAAFLAMSYVHGFSIAECAEIAFKAGAAYVKNMHNHPVGEHELLRRENPIAAKYLEPCGKGKLVFTNGCFDILHPGHLELIRFAKSKGDRLIVAINSDNSIRRLKGDKRPILPLTDRMALVAGLDGVDFVTSFDEDTPKECIEQIKPDVLVKGSDYAIEQIVGHDMVKEVYRCPLVEGSSTTNIVDKIKNQYT